MKQNWPCILLQLLIAAGMLFQPGQSFTTYSRLSFKTKRDVFFSSKRCQRRSTSLCMRDMSVSYWFTAGDSVKVVEDVSKAGHNLRGRVGQVVETWEKCDVDPTCCCAEQVDTGMAVKVEFKGTEKTDDKNSSENFYFHFAEDELIKV